MMNPDRLWQERVKQLEQDLERVKALLDSELLTGELGARFRLRLNEVTAEFSDLTKPKNGADPVALCGSSHHNSHVLRYNGVTGAFIDIFVADSGSLAGPQGD